MPTPSCFQTTNQDAPLDPADPRLRLAYDLYNRGLAEGLASANNAEVVLGVWSTSFTVWHPRN